MRCEKHACEKVWVKDSRQKSGGCLRCLECSRESRCRWYRANIEKVSEDTHRWKKDNPDKVRANSRRYYEAHSEEINENARHWHKANPDKVRAKNRRYYETHSEEINENARRRRDENTEQVREANRTYRESNPEKVKARKAVGRAVKSGDLQYAGTCWLCNEQHKQTQFHHPWGYAPENQLRVVEVCRPCHSELDQVSPEEFAATWKQVVMEAQCG